MEADLQRFYGIDYRDRWHWDSRRRLSLRRIAVLVRYLPPDAVVNSINRDWRPYWSLEHHLLDDIRRVIAHTKSGDPGDMHPLRKKELAASNPVDPRRAAKLADARRRARERRKRQGKE